MSIEEKLRENLTAAADALIVPQPKPAVLPRRDSNWRHGFGFALAGAAAVLVLAVPALILWSGGGSSSDVRVPETNPPAVVEPTSIPQSSSPTTTTPKTTSTAETTDSSGTMATLGELTVDDHTLSLVAILIDEKEPQPTATVVLQATRTGDMEPVDEAVVGTSARFFWHTVTGEGAVCEFSVDQTDSGAEITVQILLGPSLGCSDPYRFVLDGDDLTPDLEAPEAVAQQFVALWQADDEETMADLAEAEAMRQAEEMTPPAEPMFSYCEGAAGTAYCTFEVVGGELVIRVRNEPPVRVIEVISYSDN